MTDNGEIEFILDIRIIRDRKNKKMYLDQHALIERLLKNSVDILERRKQIMTTPMNSGPEHIPNAFTGDCDKFFKLRYSQIVGSLLYLARYTRPDLITSVTIASRFNNNPGPQNIFNLSKILKYLNDTKNLKFRLNEENTKDLKLFGYSDADWASDSDSKKSVSGYAVFLGNSLISWASKQQRSIAQKSMKSELIPLNELAKEITIFRQLFEELKIHIATPILLCDNKAAEKIAKNPKADNKVKHIDIREKYIMQEVEAGNNNLNRVSSKDNIADIFTKALQTETFKLNRMKLGLL
jgi:hypothetical protein